MPGPKVPDVRPITVLYRDFCGTTRERVVIPRLSAPLWLKHAALPDFEWFFEAWDVAAAESVILRAKGCNFTCGRACG